MKFISNSLYCLSYFYWQKNGGEEHRKKNIEQSPAQDNCHSQTRLASYLGGVHGLVPVKYFALFVFV